jgi:epoxyqueuosine reductase
VVYIKNTKGDSKMNDILKAEAIKHGDRLQIINARHLEDLSREIEEFKKTEELNGFQQWIVNDLYCLKFPQIGFDIKSIIIIAAHHPFYADIKFTYSGQIYSTRSLVHPEFQEVRSYLTKNLEMQGYHLYEEKNLPMKRLAVQSGLAVYGRNNITYVEGLGSNFSYMAFFTDAPCEKDEWRKMCNSEICDT